MSWAKKSWVSRSGIPELVNYPADPEGRPEPSFETALEAVEADTRDPQMAGIMSAAPTPQYSFVFDKSKDSWVCSVHGEVDYVGWVPCWAGCDEGLLDEYEDDPINEDPGTFSPCLECRGRLEGLRAV